MIDLHFEVHRLARFLTPVQPDSPRSATEALQRWLWLLDQRPYRPVERLTPAKLRQLLLLTYLCDRDYTVDDAATAAALRHFEGALGTEAPPLATLAVTERRWISLSWDRGYFDLYTCCPVEQIPDAPISHLLIGIAALERNFVQRYNRVRSTNPEL